MSSDKLNEKTVPLQRVDVQAPVNDNNTTHEPNTNGPAMILPTENREQSATNIQTQTQKIDTRALNGLRGIVAMHIMIFHSVLYSKLQWNTLGSVQMPLFFLISGFVFGISDGKQKYYPTKCCQELTHFADQDPNNENNMDQSAALVDDTQFKHFDGKNYYRRRIARTLPLYYLTNLMCLGLAVSGHGWVTVADMIGPLVLTVFAATTWFGFPSAINGPSWFVSTIWFFYWVAPSILPKLQSIENHRKQKWIWYYFWIQMGIGVGLYMATFWIVPWMSFWISTAWPPSRLPVFIMGVLAGLLRNDGLPMRKGQNENTAQQWKNASNRQAIVMICIFVVFSVIENAVWPIGSSLWLQFGYVYSQLLLIDALTFEQTSLTYRVLTSKVMLFLGRISYSLYLVHECFIQYICWIMYGSQTKPECEYEESDECAAEWDKYNDQRLMPIWCIPVLWVVSFIVAVILNRLVEEPMRKWLRPAKK